MSTADNDKNNQVESDAMQINDDGSFHYEIYEAELIADGNWNLEGKNLSFHYTLPKEMGACGLKLFSRGGASTHFRNSSLKSNPFMPSFNNFNRFFINLYLPETLKPKSKDSKGLGNWEFYNNTLN